MTDKKTSFLIFWGILSLFALATACDRIKQSEPEPQVQVIVDGLLAPIGIAALPDGSLLVAEDGTGADDLSSGISLITPDGQVGRLISGIPSSRDTGDLAGAPFVGLSPPGDKIYIGHFGSGQLWTLPLLPDGLSLPDVPFQLEMLTPEMVPLNNVKLTNPFDITFDAEGVPVVSDPSGNGVAKMNPDGTTRFIHRFASLPNPVKAGVPIEAVPTGLTRVGDEYYVALTGGCPFPEGGGQIVAIDEDRNQRTLASGLNMPIDVALGQDGTIWVLEFARFTPDASCFTGKGYQARTGRLSILHPDGSLDTVLEGLDYPGAVLPMPDGSLYITEIFPGRVLHITFDGPESARDDLTQIDPPSSPQAVPTQAILDLDEALKVMIDFHNLQPNPGAASREGDTRLAQLGQALFFDPILSGDQNISCASCHHPLFSMGDGRALPIGTGGNGLGPTRTFDSQITLGPEAQTSRLVEGEPDSASGSITVQNPYAGVFIPRNSPTVINSALFPTMFWDSRVEEIPNSNLVQSPEEFINELALTDPLVVQALLPLVSEHEMAGATLGDYEPQVILPIIIERLQAIPAYVAYFESVFGPGADAISLSHLAEALGAFESRFIFTNAPWDLYLAGNRNTLTDEQKRGALIFFGESNPAVNCSLCHSGDLFSNFSHHNLMVPQLGPGKNHGYTGREDWGRAGVTFDLRDRYTFRTPSLRNVSLTPPYFHDGAFSSLAEVIQHHANIWGSADNYDPSAHGVPAMHFSSLQPFQPEKQWTTAAPILRDGLPLSETEITDLVAFIESLTDPEAHNLSGFIPDKVPSGLPLDELPETITLLPTAVSPEVLIPMSGVNETLPMDVTFRDVAADVGLDFYHGAFKTSLFADPVAMMGGGLCWIDYDNDGWLDLYLVNSHAEEEVDFWRSKGGLPRNALYHNQRGKFTDVSAGSGTDLALRGNGCVAADFNRDGNWDLYVTADGPNAMLLNNGDGTFREVAGIAGVASPEWSSAAVAGDVNGDGWTDLFVAAYIDLENKIPNPSGAFPQDYYGLPDHLYLNLGENEGGVVTFHDVTLEAGLTRAERGLGALFSDLDQDGDLDLYIANDGHHNRLYGNEQDEGEGLGFYFVEWTDSAEVGDSGSGMGIAGGDYDGDGWTDLFVTNWEREVNALYRNEMVEKGQLIFQYSTYRIGISGLGNEMTGWGTAWLDFDHDTDLDLIVANGRVPISNLEADGQLVRLYRNRNWESDGSTGLPGRFIEGTKTTGLDDLGPILGRGSAMADFDNDGDVDLAINTISGQLVLLENEGAKGNWLQINFDGFCPGARANLTLPDGRRLIREVYAGSSYLASEDPRLHFGLGQHQIIPSLEVIFPDGQTEYFQSVQANQMLQVACQN